MTAAITIHIANQQQLLNIKPLQLKRTVKHVLKHADQTLATVSIAVVDDQTLYRLKKQFLHQPVVSDVLSFNLNDTPDPHDCASGLDCEVVVNAQRALQVASGCSADPLAELNLYLVHGLLHQLGFDDRTPRQAKIMHETEDQLLVELGFGNVFFGRKR